MLNRRKLITGLIAFGCAPAIVRASSLMPVKVIDLSPQKIINEAMSRIIGQYDGIIGSFNPVRLYWHTSEGLKIIPIEQSDYYLRSLDANS